MAYVRDSGKPSLLSDRNPQAQRLWIRRCTVHILAAKLQETAKEPPSEEKTTLDQAHRRMVKISDSRRAELKKPLGILIADKDITAEAIAEHAGVDASYITVGDASTERASTLGLNVCMEIVDCLEKRVSRSAPDMRENFTITVYKPSRTHYSRC